MGRKFESLPKNMEVVKREFTKVKNMFFARSKVIDEKADRNWKNDTYKIEKEAFGLFWLLIQEFNAFMIGEEKEITEKILEVMSDNKLYLYKYNIKIIYDEEARWFRSEEITESEWRDFDKKCNAEFLKK